MTRCFVLLSMLLVIAYGEPRQRRQHTTTQSSGVKVLAAQVAPPANNQVIVKIRGNKRTIRANGVPSHLVGKFPNSGNPNAIAEQDYTYEMTTNPQLAEKTTPLQMSQNFGVAINGIPFDPGAAEWFGGAWHSEWQYEALSGAVALGVDENHAHVQPNGAYHYHGLPTKLLNRLGVTSGRSSPIVGWAADGFPIFALYGTDANGKVRELKSSYQLKKGKRPSGGEQPGGTYDGTFIADYSYVAGSGDLDECNGKKLDSKFQYAYFLTREFPVIPRCFKGSPHPSFQKKVDRQAMRPPHGHHHRKRRPPREAMEACRGKTDGATCRFQGRGGPIVGKCFYPPGRRELACR